MGGYTRDNRRVGGKETYPEKIKGSRETTKKGKIKGRGNSGRPEEGRKFEEGN